jgi:predicted flap endonuclease-1-like 5' DNA nuclease
MKVIEIEGIGPANAKKLEEIGISSVEALLDNGSTPKGRKEIASKTGIADVHVLKWVNRADLFRVKGIGSQYSDLLEASGVDTVVELAARKPEHLAKKMSEVNEVKKLVRQLPSEKQVAEWIEHAKSLPRAISY